VRIQEERKRVGGREKQWGHWLVMGGPRTLVKY
jgi:hypothetical protein